MKKLTIVSILAIALCIVPFMNTAIASDDELPSWIKTTKLKGDIRFRYQTEDRAHDDDQIDRDRWRIRWRFGVESEPNDNWKVGFGLASGSDDGRSTNQTLENFFDTPDARLDYAYAKWMPMENIDVMFGKFKNPIWTTKDLLWDSDIMPEGIAATFDLKASDNVDFFITPAFFVLDEDKNDEDDPNMMALQAGVKMDFTDAISSKLAVSYYKLNNTENSALVTIPDDDGDDDTNFVLTEEDVSAWAVDGEIGFSALPVYVALFGQYVSTDADDYETGYLFGVKCGDKKVKELGDWQLKYNYRKLETFGWSDLLPDSDFMGGDTNVKGSEIELVVGLHKNVTIGLDYYMAEVDDDYAGIANPDYPSNSLEIPSNKQDMDLIQIDLVVKF